jgi:hypothetical protein
MELNDGPKSRLVVDAYRRDCRRPCLRFPDFGVLVCAGRINANLVAYMLAPLQTGRGVR